MHPIVKSGKAHKTFGELERSLGLKNWKEWYHYKGIDIVGKHKDAKWLLGKFESSLVKLLLHFHYDKEWEPWRFEQVPNGFWENKTNRLLFFNFAEKELGLKNKEDWYRVKNKDIKRIGGGGLLVHYYNDSLSNALMDVYSEDKFKLWNFNLVSGKYWTNILHQKEFLFEVSKHLNIFPYNKNGTYEDWYSVSAKEIMNFGGNGLGKLYGFSTYKILSAIYPEYEWNVFKFKQVPRNHWSNSSNIIKAMEGISKTYNIDVYNYELQDWNKVSVKQLEHLGLSALIQRYGGFHKLITAFYSLSLSSNYANHPNDFIREYFWNKKQNILAGKAVSKPQQRIFEIVTNLFPDKNIHVNFIHPNFRHFDSKINIQFDIFIPQLSLGFEYQGEQHYSNARGNKAIQSIQLLERDKEKRVICKEHGITLIEVPYWWNQTQESLSSMIQSLRPELLKETRFLENKEL